MKRINGKYLFYIIAVLLTVIFIFCNIDYYLVDLNVSYSNIIRTVLLTLLICLAASINKDKIKPEIIYLLAFIMFFFTPVYIIIAIMNNYHIALIRLWLMNYSIYFIILLFFLAATSRCSIASMIGTVAAFLVFTLNTEVTLFRGSPIVPADAFAIGTAINVADNYSFKLTYEVFSSFQATVLWCILAVKLNKKLKGNIKGNLIIGVAAVAMSVLFINGFNNYFEKNKPDKLYYDKYDTALSNKKFGTALTYAVNIKKMIIKKPEGYSVQTAEEIAKSLQVPTAEDNISPNIVVVMDEAFSDLTSVYNISTDKEIIPNFRVIRENAVKGNMLVSVFGGNTSVTEFEFLTGLTAGSFNKDTNAFSQLITKPVNSLCYDLKALNSGYKTIAIHPFWGESWRRNKVYPLLGFDKSIFAENFNDESALKRSGSMRSKPRLGDANYVRGYLSDDDSFNKIKEQFENKNENEKLFVFNVTIQNHGAYNYSGDDFKSEIKLEGENNPELEQYLTLVNKSDAAIGRLIDYFKDYSEPTVVVIFGDHQPNISFKKTLKEEYSYLGKDSKYIVPFVIWANYDIKEQEVELTSPAYLSALVKESCGIPMNSWDGFRNELNNEYSALTLNTCYDSRQNKLDTAELNSDIYKKYKILQYGILFDGLKP